MENYLKDGDPLHVGKHFKSLPSKFPITFSKCKALMTAVSILMAFLDHLLLGYCNELAVES